MEEKKKMSGGLFVAKRPPLVAAGLDYIRLIGKGEATFLAASCLTMP
jgi:hypothetical protein